MATIVNNPPANSDSGGGGGFLLGVIVLIVFVVLFIFYGLPYLSSNMGNGGTQAPQVNVPDKLDVNVNQPK